MQYPANADLSAVVDLNHDNRPDIVNVFDDCPIEVSVRMNSGARTFGPGSFFEDLGCGPYPSPRSLSPTPTVTAGVTFSF